MYSSFFSRVIAWYMNTDWLRRVCTCTYSVPGETAICYIRCGKDLVSSFCRIKPWFSGSVKFYLTKSLLFCSRVVLYLILNTVFPATCSERSLQSNIVTVLDNRFCALLKLLLSNPSYVGWLNSFGHEIETINFCVKTVD